jgi:hypothetical protein
VSWERLPSPDREARTRGLVIAAGLFDVRDEASLRIDKLGGELVECVLLGLSRVEDVAGHHTWLVGA